MIRFICIILLFSFPALIFAQKEKKEYPISYTGSIRSNILLPEKDDAIGIGAYKDKFLTNTYVDLNILSKYIDAGGRLEYLKHPLPGFEPDFSGWGVPYFYATGKYKMMKLTLGDFYDQFGSGLIFRTYEEQNLGIDNSLRGARMSIEPFKGVYAKILGGKQRRYWDHNDSFVWGADLEFNLEQWINSLEKGDIYMMLGGSFVSKHEKDEIIAINATERLHLPQNVGASDVRFRLQKGGFSFLTEYAWKVNDPSKDNNYSYQSGQVLLLSASYSRQGLAALLQAKRSNNMSFRSKRSQTLNSSFINHLPAFTVQHTYALAALYPYATQPDGEWALQSSLAYNFKRNSWVGGQYGTSVKLNMSHIRSIASPFLKAGDQRYYQDIHFSIDKRWTNNFKLNLMYMNQYFNQFVIQGHGDSVRSDIFVTDGTWRIDKKQTLRFEFQHLNTKDDEGNWLYALIELSVLPYFMFTLSDMYNTGLTNTHYYKGMITFTYKSHFMQLGYGRTRAGYDCSGGVCREVPASKGMTLSYNYIF